MPLERVDSRTPSAVLILVCAGGVAWAWRALAGAPYGVEIAVVTAAAVTGAHRIGIR